MPNRPSKEARNAKPTCGVMTWELGRRSAAVKLSPEQREARAAVIDAVGRLVRDYWAQEQAGPVPDHLTRLIARLGDDVIEAPTSEGRDADTSAPLKPS
jgi:hypothetical protein